MSASAGVARPGDELRVAVLASGEGTTFEGLAIRLEELRIGARVTLVVVDRTGAPVLQRARRRAVPAVVLPSQGVDSEIWGTQLEKELEQGRIDVVVLAGFLTILPPRWVERWTGRAINIHPSLLPRYGGRGMYGRRVHRAVLAAGERESGATVHLVTSAVDGGPILLQERVAVRPDDTEESLRSRVHPVEVRLLADAIRRFADGSWPLPYVGVRPTDPTAGTSPSD
jgi:phosphoribosylglycinamide formyltransferase 1